MISVSLGHGLKKSLLVDKWKQIDTHPSISCSVYVKFELDWVEVNDLGSGFVEKVSVASWDCMSRLLWQD